MKTALRITASLVLASYLGFMGVLAFHSHTTADVKTDCQICQITHQAPALVNPSAPLLFTAGIQAAPPPLISHPFLRFVFQSHGLAPPTL